VPPTVGITLRLAAPANSAAGSTGTVVSTGDVESAGTTVSGTTVSGEAVDAALPPFEFEHAASASAATVAAAIQVLIVNPFPQRRQ
jgi:hypothetical protein